MNSPFLLGLLLALPMALSALLTFWSALLGDAPTSVPKKRKTPPAEDTHANRHRQGFSRKLLYAGFRSAAQASATFSRRPVPSCGIRRRNP